MIFLMENSIQIYQTLLRKSTIYAQKKAAFYCCFFL